MVTGKFIFRLCFFTSVGSCPQYCRMLQYAILPAGPCFHSLLHCSGSSHTLQVLSSRLPSLHERQHHAQVWIGACVCTCTCAVLSVFGWSINRLASVLSLCRGMTEGITLLILAVQTGLIELQVIHRAFLLSIILFIVVASILQSMLEIADPIVLALGASRDKWGRNCNWV